MDVWTKRFLEMAKLVAGWSKDPSTQLGAVFVKDKRILSMGYNGFPRGISDDSSRYENRETKYKHVVHAEMNGIFNATHHGVSLNGSTVYVYGLPICPECAKGLIQVGVASAVCVTTELGDSNQCCGKRANWDELWKTSQEMFDEVGIISFKYKEDDL